MKIILLIVSISVSQVMAMNNNFNEYGDPEEAVMLRKAAQHGNLDMVKWLIDKGINPNTVTTEIIPHKNFGCEIKQTALEAAVFGHHDDSQNNLPVIQELLNHGASITKEAIDIAEKLPLRAQVKEFFKQQKK